MQTLLTVLGHSHLDAVFVREFLPAGALEVPSLAEVHIPTPWDTFWTRDYEKRREP
jgi:hypothetical protein